MLDIEEVKKALNILSNSFVIRIYHPDLTNPTELGFRCFNDLYNFRNSERFDVELLREGVFETNSSSTHSVSIGNCKELVIDETIVIKPNGMISLDSSKYKYFSTEIDAHNDFGTKMAYLVAGSEYALALNKGELPHTDEVMNASNYFQKIIKQLRKFFPSFLGFEFNLPKPKSKYTNPGGAIDHQSCMLPTSIKKIGKYLVDKNSWLITGDDGSNKPYKKDELPILSNDKVIASCPHRYADAIYDWLPLSAFKTNINDDARSFRNYLQLNASGRVTDRTLDNRKYEGLWGNSLEIGDKSYIIFILIAQKVSNHFKNLLRNLPYFCNNKNNEKLFEYLKEEGVFEDKMINAINACKTELDKFVTITNLLKINNVLKEIKCVELI
jgi:mannitol/fructose-specific phosphotransferase system IIA component (Ntr-type)